MNNTVRNILAVVAGIVVGMIVNITLVNVGPSIIPIPEGADISSMEAMTKSMPLFRAENFIFPFLAHALGSFSGAFVAAKLATSHKMAFALGIGAFTMLGGIAAVVMLPAPLWFEVADLILAYIPTAYIAGLFAKE